MDILVTNNILIKESYESGFQVEYAEESLHDVLIRARGYVHNGHRLLTHPLSGSVKPNETPYKSVLISEKNGELDIRSLQIIESSILTAKNFEFKFKDMPERYLQDFREVDFSLIRSAIVNLF